VSGDGGITVQRGYEFSEILQLDDARASFVDVDHHGVLAARGQCLDQRSPGLAIPTNQVERFAHLAYVARKPIFRDRLLEGTILHQGKDGTEGVDPGNHRGVKRQAYPDSLAIRELIRNLAEAYRGRHIADEVERVKDTHVPDIAIRILARDYGEAEYGHRIDHQQRQQGLAHPAKYQEDDVFHLPEPADGLAAQHHGFDYEQYHGDHIRQHCAARERDDTRRHDRSEPGSIHVNGIGPYHRRGNQLQNRHQAGRQQQGAHLAAVTKFEHRGDQIYHHDGKQFVEVMMIGIFDLADEESEIERQRQDNKETENDLFRVHGYSPIVFRLVILEFALKHA
jgi:hypothetical protein